MQKCKCSERPLGIIDSKVEIIEGKPYQVLLFGCTNRKCNEYKKAVIRKEINLLDNSETKEINL